LDYEELILKLEEALEIEEWELVQEAIDTLRVEAEKSFDSFDEEDW
jgi:hypothetical protein